MTVTNDTDSQHESVGSPPKDTQALVVGISFRLPTASNFEELSYLLKPTRNKESPKATRLDQFGTIDADFFKVSPKEACQSSPLLGTLLEVVAECIMESGIPLKEVTVSRTGLYLQSNLSDAYMELTCNVAHYFDFKGPVVSYGGLDVSPTNAIHTAMLDMATRRCEMAVVVGVCKQGRFQPTTEKHIDGSGHHRRFHECATEGVVAVLIKSPGLKLMSRVHCEIVSVSQSDTLAPDDKDSRIADTSSTMAGIFLSGMVGKQSKISCPYLIDEMLKGAESISALVGVIISICLSKQSDKSTKGSEYELDNEIKDLLCQEQKYYFVKIVIQCLRHQKHEIKLRMTNTPSYHENKEEYKAALIPITVHPKGGIAEAEKSLNLYENVPGFLPYLINSDLCKGLKSHLQQLYFKTPERSYFSNQDYTSYGEMPMTIIFDDFLLSPWKPSSDILNLPLIEKSLSAFDETLRNDAVSAMSIYEKTISSKIPETTEEGGITTRIACQMAVVDLLKAVNTLGHVRLIKASGLGSVAASYADGALTRTQAVQVALALEDALLTAARRHGEKSILDVACSLDDIYRLGPWVQVLGPLSQDGFRVATPMDRRENLTSQLGGKGFKYREHCIRVPLYNPVFKTHLDGRLGKSLGRIIPHRALWSSKIVILGFQDKAEKYLECSSSFFEELLSTSFDDELQMKKTSGLFLENVLPVSSENVCGSNASVSPCNFDNFDVILQNYKTENSENDIPSDSSKSDQRCQPEAKRAGGNVLQEIQVGASSIDITKRENLLLTPRRDLESINCSTNAIKGSFLCSQSVATGSVSSASEFQSEDMSEYMKSNTSQLSPSSDTVLMEGHTIETEPRRTNDVNMTLQLHFFGSDSDTDLMSNKELEDSSIQTNVSSGSTLVQNDVHMRIKPNQVSLLETLAWIHSTGSPMEGDKQLCQSTAHERYNGDFGIHNLWTWNRQPCCRIHSALSPNFDIKENVRIYSLSSKPRLSEAVLQNLISNRNLEEQAHLGASNCSIKRRPSVCPFDSSLLLLSGYQWDSCSGRIIPIHSPDSLSEDLKMQKKVRFSHRSRSKRCLDPHLVENSVLKEIDDLIDDDNKEELADDLQFGFADRGDLIEVLNCVRSDDFRFVSLLHIDDSMERYLLDILYTFPLTSALHVFVTPKLRATSTSKYVINVSRRISTFGDEVVVVLRDRSTDQSESCSSVTNALSILSSFEEGIHEMCLARVFELPFFLDDGSFSVERLEFMIFDSEIEVSREMYSGFDQNTGAEYSTSSTSSSSCDIDDFGDNNESDVDCNGNFESKVDAEENSSIFFSNNERPPRERNSSPNLMTNFCLNFEPSSVEALMKLSKINDHTLVCVQPKPTILFANAESLSIEGDLDFCDEVRESDAPHVGQQDKAIYMISLKSVPESQVFLYCKDPKDISRWDNIKDAVDELMKRHPSLPETHEAFVSKFDEKLIPFEELLYSFLYDSCNIEKENHKRSLFGIIQDCSKLKTDLQENQDDDNNNPHKTDDDHGMQGAVGLKTPCMFSNGFMIPDIVISPPESFVTLEYSQGNVHPSPYGDGLSQETVCSHVVHVNKHDIIGGGTEEHEDFTFEPKLECSDKMKRFESSRINEIGEQNEPSTVTGIQSFVGTGDTAEEHFCALETKTLKPPSIAHNEELSRPCLNANSSSSSDALEDNSKYTDLGNTMSEQETESSPPRPENDSDKENTLIFAEPEVFDDFGHLKNPGVEDLEHMTNFRISAALVVHLIDKISSFHEQRGRAAGNMLLYVARERVTTNNDEPKAFFGMIVFDDLDIRHSRFSIPNSFEDTDLETALNYILGWYILRVLARISREKAPMMKTLVQPPIQRDSASIMLVASSLGCGKIVTSSCLEEHRDDIYKMVPGCVVLKNEIDRMAVLPVVGKEGVDVIIMIRQQEVDKMLDLLSPSGCLVLCGEVDRTMEVRVRSIANNGHITLFDALSAARYMTTMAEKEKEGLQQDLQCLLSNHDSQLDVCYPPSKEGYFYQVLGRFTTSKDEEQPPESTVHEMFFSTTRTLMSVFGSVTELQWNVLGKIFETMAKCSGDDCFSGDGRRSV